MASLRRNVRLRREYLYRKSLEAKEHAVFSRKQALRGALRSGKAIPTELRGEEASLRHEIEAEDAVTGSAPRTHADDEYAYAGAADPRVCVTTSRAPSSKLAQFAKEIRLLVPNAKRINRGNSKVEELVDSCRNHAFTDLVLCHETRGVPTSLVICHLPYGPTAHFSLVNVVMRHDIEDCGTISEAYPHLIFDNLSSKLGARCTAILKHLFPVPKPESERIITFANVQDHIAFRHHTFRTVYVDPTASKEGEEGEEEDSDSDDEEARDAARGKRRRGGEADGEGEGEGGKNKRRKIELQEVGPRFEMRPYMIKLGTLDQNEADVEWIRHSFMNSSHKKKLLSAEGSG